MVTDFFILLKQELAVTLVMFLLLILKLGKERSNAFILTLVNILLLVNFICGCCFTKDGFLFGSMFHTNALITTEKNILNLAMWLVSLVSYSWLSTHKHVTEFYVLLLSALLGMFFMISAGNLLMFYLGLELSTIPLAAAVNFDSGKRRSSEAAFKMIISSAFSSALLLLGISFVYGVSGTIVFAELGQHMLVKDPLHIFSFVLLLSAFAFKISAVPFHLWTADVYEGAPVAVTSYLSVVSKAAALFALLTFLYEVSAPMYGLWYNILVVVSLLTIIVGNLFALRQENMKRFLAFSSIAQAGFIMIGMSAGTPEGMASVIYFLLVYVFSNLAAFGVLGVVNAATNLEGINDIKGFYKTNPQLSRILTIALFSLAGVPPAAGFFGKFFLLMAGAARGNYLLIAAASLNMVVSFYYYLKIVRAMFMDRNEHPVENIAVPAWTRLGLYICVAGIICTGLTGIVYQFIFSLCKGI